MSKIDLNPLSIVIEVCSKIKIRFNLHLSEGAVIKKFEKLKKQNTFIQSAHGNFHANTMIQSFFIRSKASSPHFLCITFHEFKTSKNM